VKGVGRARLEADGKLLREYIGGATGVVRGGPSIAFHPLSTASLAPIAQLVERLTRNEPGACPPSSAQVRRHPATFVSCGISGHVVSADVRRCPSESRQNCPHFCPPRSRRDRRRNRVSLDLASGEHAGSKRRAGVLRYDAVVHSNMPAAGYRRPALASKDRRPLAPQIHHVDVGAEPHVVGEVRAVMIGIGVENDFIIIPAPVVGVVRVVWDHLKEEAVDVESIALAAAKPPDVLPTDWPRKMSLSPGMTETIVGIVTAGAVSHPRVILGADMRGFELAWLIPETAAVGGGGVARTRCLIRRPHWRRSSGGDMSAASAAVAPARGPLPSLSLLVIAVLALLTAWLVAASALTERDHREEQRCEGKPDQSVHALIPLGTIAV
jgi:hypothetical protein